VSTIVRAKWTQLTNYPGGLEDKIEKTWVFQNRRRAPDEPLWWIVAKANEKTGNFAFPVHVIIPYERSLRFGDGRLMIQYGMVYRNSPWKLVDGLPLMDDTRTVNEMPSCSTRHIRAGDPNYVVINKLWIPLNAYDKPEGDQYKRRSHR
jgi:hypothetical protein